ncbi:hypothetical protein B0H13DRAFT_1457221, partial [Mycena leptocephala]
PAERDLEKLVQNASGQFIYAATVIKFVDEYCHPVEQLKFVLALPASQTSTSAFADLDALYTFVLRANPDTPLLLRILGAHFTIPQTLDTHCLSFLDDILGLARGIARFTLRGFHSVLFIPDSDEEQILVYHASPHDFLFNRTWAGVFFLDRERNHRELAWRCLSIL